MPPKAKFTKKQIIDAGLDIIRNDGIENLTARELGKRLGSSACPIFTVFNNMEEVQVEAKNAAKVLYGEYIKNGLKETPAFKGVGMQYILFAIKEPKLFQLLFMTEQKNKPQVANILPIIDDNYEDILLSVQNSYNLSKTDSEALYRHLWIYTHGIAVLCATNTCCFTIDEISKMISEAFKGFLKEIKGGSSK